MVVCCQKQPVDLLKDALSNRQLPDTLAERRIYERSIYVPTLHTHRMCYMLIHIHACTFMSTRTSTRTHSGCDKITNALHCCVQDLTMWESDLLVRVCSGWSCNQHNPKAKPSRRKSSSASAVTSCLGGKPGGGTRGESRIQFLWPLT